MLEKATSVAIGLVACSLGCLLVGTGQGNLFQVMMLKEPLGKEVPSLGMAKCPEFDEERV